MSRPADSCELPFCPECHRYGDDDRDRRRRHDYHERHDRDRDRNRRGHYSDGSDQDCDRRSRLKSYRRDFDDDDDDLRRQEKKARHYEDEKSDDDESHKSKSIYNGGDGELMRIPRAAISPPALFAYPPSHPPLVMQPQPIPSIRTASHVLRPPMPERLVVAAVVQMRVITSRRSRLRTSTGKTTPKIGSVRKSRTATTTTSVSERGEAFMPASKDADQGMPINPFDARPARANSRRLE